MVMAKATFAKFLRLTITRSRSRMRTNVWLAREGDMAAFPSAREIALVQQHAATAQAAMRNLPWAEINRTLEQFDRMVNTPAYRTIMRDMNSARQVVSEMVLPSRAVKHSEPLTSAQPKARERPAEQSTPSDKPETNGLLVQLVDIANKTLDVQVKNGSEAAVWDRWQMFVAVLALLLAVAGLILVKVP